MEDRASILKIHSPVTAQRAGLELFVKGVSNQNRQVQFSLP